MAEEKLNTGPEGQIGLGDVVKDEPGGGVGGPGDVEVSAEQIEALMAEKKAAERAALEREEAGGEKAPEAGGPKKDGPPALPRTRAAGAQRLAGPLLPLCRNQPRSQGPLPALWRRASWFI